MNHADPDVDQLDHVDDQLDHVEDQADDVAQADAAAAANAAARGDLLGLVRRIPALRWRTYAIRYGVDFSTVDQDMLLLLIIGAHELYRNGCEGPHAGRRRDDLERFEQMPLDDLLDYVNRYNRPTPAQEDARKS